MDIKHFKRRIYTQGITPIQRLNHLTELLQGPEVYVKRDDLLGLLGGGSKTRKLEYLMADAIEKGADSIITCGAVQSNHCRLTLSAASLEGLDCHLFLEERVKNSYNPKANGNNFIYHLLGATSIHVISGDSDLVSEMDSFAEQLKAEGHRPYIIPVGGSNPIGDLGYLNCIEEILSQEKEMDIQFDHIVCTSGSGGTHAGLLAGVKDNNRDISVTGICINRMKELQTNAVYHHAVKACEIINSKVKINYKDINLFDDYIGEGYSKPTPQMIQAVILLAKTEAILLDPVYTGKTMAGMIDLINKDYFKKDEKILFMHTGGIPGIYAHTDEFMSN
ncbi:MAG: D-cysteine desulfhydrase [Tissierellales bacterium]|nr:D-cysteine desulfhydrase [Tissierellales bacterium]MBN2826919.1 D-cysteine desulfhydrase [Tissierellales bacterium]